MQGWGTCGQGVLAAGPFPILTRRGDLPPLLDMGLTPRSPFSHGGGCGDGVCISNNACGPELAGWPRHGGAGVGCDFTEEIAKKCDVRYRVRAQKYGLMGWAMNGEPAVITGRVKRAKAV